MSTASTAVVVPGSRKDDSLAELHQNAAVSDSLTLAQQESIERSIKESQALIGDVENVSVLIPEYRENPLKGFLLGIEDLKKRYSGIRRVRGDGNCFYRAYLYSFMTALVKASAAGGDAAARASIEWNDLVKRVKDSKDWLVGVGYNETAIESFYDVFVEELEATSSRTVPEVHGLFNEEQGVMSYCVWYLRLLTAGFLKLNRDEFAPFLDDGMGDVEGFCAREVEPVGKECEQIHIIALTRALHVGVRIEYLDGRSFADHIDQMIFPEGSEPKITLLYRPGHYDVLES